MTMTATRRYPLQPLQAAARADNLHTLANRLGLTHRHLRRMQAQGLADREADRYACTLGYHPTEIWTDWHDIDDDDIDDDDDHQHVLAVTHTSGGGHLRAQPLKPNTHE